MLIAALVACVALPLALYGAGVSWLLTRDYEQHQTGDIQNVANALSVAVDAELDAAVRLAESLAAIVEANGVDAKTFHALAASVLARNPTVSTVVLTSIPERRHLSHSNLPPGVSTPASADAAVELAMLAEQGEPLIGGVRRGPTAATDIVPTWAPVKGGSNRRGGGCCDLAEPFEQSARHRQHSEELDRGHRGCQRADRRP